MISIAANIGSLTLNRFQISLIQSLKFPASESEIEGVSDVYSPLSELVMPWPHSLEEPPSRHLSSSQSGSSSGSDSSVSSGSGSSTSGGSDSSTNSGSAVASSLSSSTSHSTTSGSSQSSSGSHSSSHSHSGPHPHDALLYLFNTLLVGAAVMQLSAKYPILQQTIVLFIFGFMVSLILHGLKLEEKIAVWGDSYQMWVNIDPHLLLFTLLPALLAGDAMTIDTSVAKSVGLQCVYLAGPGVLIGSFGAAFFLDNYIGWKTDKSFLLSLCAGSILCATDPVAVVALLKELGASPVLTVQIQGESLLNDGTAIVLYLISYSMLSGEEYDPLDILTFLLEKAVMAFALGLFIGYFFFGWIRLVSNKLDHACGMIQIVLTLCCAYCSFIIVEGILELSGVLATVAASIVLAHHMWPFVVSVESMHQVWHTAEALGNIIVFFLAGSITGFIVVEIDFIDWFHLLVIYAVLLLIRASLLFGSRRILQYLHADNMPVSWQDATLMTWGGLRGAVGLALAIQVNNGRAPNKDQVLQIDEKDAQRLLFFCEWHCFLDNSGQCNIGTMARAEVGHHGNPESESEASQAVPQAASELV
jgi:sodium/hydrogen exchanger 10/11